MPMSRLRKWPPANGTPSGRDAEERLASELLALELKGRNADPGYAGLIHYSDHLQKYSG